MQSASIKYIELMSRKGERGLAIYTSYSPYSSRAPFLININIYLISIFLKGYYNCLLSLIAIIMLTRK